MIRTETDVDRCRELWTQLSPGIDPWDDWDIVFAFHDDRIEQLNFLVLDNEDGHPAGLVPLVHDTAKHRYTLMGGSYPDGRILWLRHEDFPLFFDALPEPTVMFDLKKSRVSTLLQMHPQYEACFSDEDLRYYLVPSQFDYDFHNHIDTFTRDKRQKFLYDLRNIGKREPVLHWGESDEADLFIDLVNRNFGDDSDYNDADNARQVRRVIGALHNVKKLRTLTIDVAGSKQAVSMSLLHNNRMVALYAASNNDYNNLGKLLNVETIQEACRLRVDEISFMTGMQWKANWQMQGEPCITLRKPAGGFST